ncbi:hypothetical protein [Deinococcus ruber]|uniref:Uncharacterized protein n=1 Tax=Deinococcus ruber TaxID=1848197 RepID=A0A918CC38_9DEIO|nr:hypothetical protein [Deinococcus ruber]GGR16949.1 hypothetical protein GCM10008957_31990 [Deinococcus ruber]
MIFQLVVAIIVLQVLCGVAFGLYVGYLGWRGPRYAARMQRAFRMRPRRHIPLTLSKSSHPN